MFNDISYFNFDEKKDLVYYFLKRMFDKRKGEILNILDGYINFEGNALNEELFIYFSIEIYEKDEEYFGPDKIAFYFCYPFLEEDCIVLLYYNQFYNSLVSVFKTYIGEFSKDEINKITEKLDILKSKLKVY